MRLCQLALLFLFAASASASIGPLAGAAGGFTMLGKSLLGLASAAVAPGLGAVILPIALLKATKLFIAVKAVKLVKVGLLAPIAAPVGLALAGKAAIAHSKTHLAKTALRAKAALVELPLQIAAAKAGAIHGAIAGGKSGYSTYQPTSRSSIAQPEVLLASDLLKTYVPASVAQVEPEVPGYGAKASTHSPPAPAYVPHPQPAYKPLVAAPSAPADAPNHYRKRRQVAFDAATEKAVADTFARIREEDTDRCFQRSMCQVAVEPTIAEDIGSEMVTFLGGLPEDVNATWHPFQQAVVLGGREKSHDACARSFPECTKDVKALIAEAVHQLGFIR